MPEQCNRTSLTRALVTAVVPAYVAPALMSGTSAMMIGDPRLLAASYTTIAIPSALAAVAVTLWLSRGDRRDSTSPGRERQAKVWRALVAGALGCLAPALVICALLFAARIFDAWIFGDALPSAAIGGGITAVQWARKRTRQSAANQTPDQAGSLATYQEIAAKTRRAGDRTIALGGLLLVVGLVGPWSAGCAGPRTAPAASLSGPADGSTAAVSQLAPHQVSTATWNDFLDTVDTCRARSRAAESHAMSMHRRQRVGGVISTVSGTLATGAGAASGALAATMEDSDLSMISGMTALGLGVVAAAGGIYANNRSGSARRSSAASRNIARAISRHTLVALSGADDGDRDRQVRDAGARLARECAQHAGTDDVAGGGAQ